MKKGLFLKILGLYALLSLVSFFVAATLGRQLVEDARVKSRAEQMYLAVQTIASEEGQRYFSKESSLRSFYAAIHFLDETTNANILLIDPSGMLLLDSGESPEGYRGETLKDFNYASFGPGYYEIGDFFGHYEEKHLSVLLPVLDGYHPQGYIAMCLPMSVIEAERESIMWGVDIVVAVNLFLAASLLVFFSLAVDRPLGEIADGARQFAAGNLSHRIRISSKDELGNLSEVLNLMAAELKKGKDYQTSFLSNVSHDLRSPLTSIKGFTEAMIDGTIPPEMHTHYLEIISGEADRLEKLTSSVLSLEKMQTGEAALTLSDFDINALLRSTAEVFEGSCRKKKISIRLILTGDELLVRADREKIQQVIYNLLDNAIKFSDRGSAIELESAIRHGKCFVSVKDEGSGIPAADLPHIWDRFYKSDASRGKDRKGSGLGLSIVKEIITAHGQTITVTSTENTGTEFVFSLPMT